MMDKSITYPSFYYSREESDYPMPVFYPIHDRLKDGSLMATSFYRLEQLYTGVILVEKQAEAVELMSKLRFYLHRNPYVTIPWQALGSEFGPDPNDERNELLRVGIRLLYMKVVSTRTNKDEKGAQRAVEFGWRSDLFISENYTPKLYKRIKLYLNNNLLKIFELE